MIYAYMRVSTEEQILARQELSLNDYCVKNKIEIPAGNIYSDKATGKTFNRASYMEMKGRLLPGDILIISSIDRLGRNWDGIKKEWEYFIENKINVVILDMPLLSYDPMKITTDMRLIREISFTIFCYLSQKEVEKISQRTKEGMAAAKRRGSPIGKPPKNPEGIDRNGIIRLYKQGKTYAEIMETLNVSRITVVNTVKAAIQKGKLEPRRGTMKLEEK